MTYNDCISVQCVRATPPRPPRDSLQVVGPVTLIDMGIQETMKQKQISSSYIPATLLAQAVKAARKEL